ncbi:MAG: tryptophan 7-halogenase [Alphaproteobacteria bacterium]|nr:tryptophan 7-halogenase [Alphaproteobacteria bacterium]
MTRSDVLILGTGLGGTLLGACLASRGVKVTMLDAGVHPRFAIGEATTPDTSFRLKLLARKYDVPEIADLGAFYALRDAIGPSSGIKRAFSFVYHQPGHPVDLHQAHQYPTFAPPLGPDCHLFRQDSDAWMVTVAMRHGAKVHQSTRATDIRFDEDGVTVQTHTGEQHRARFLVDAAGFGSPLMRQLGLQQDPLTLQTDSRSLFTHMIGVPSFDGLVGDVNAAGIPYPLCQSTLHHVFPGGWMWVIPFDNHPDAVNPLCSVGLMLDRSVYPETGKPAEEEFREIIARFPDMARHFEGAAAVRPWVSTGRIQQRASQVVGDRWALMAHAAGFVDPLYSSGLNLTAGVVDQLTSLLVAACADGDFRRARFEPIEAFFFRNLDLYDRVVANSYRSFHHFGLWDAWYRVWVIGLLIGTGVNGNLYMRHEAGLEPDLKATEREPATGLLGSQVPECRAMLEEAFALFDTLQPDGANADAIADRLRALLAASPCTPDYWQWGDKAVRSTPAFTVGGLLRLRWWFLRNAPPALAQRIFAWKVSVALRYLTREVLRQRRKARSRSRRYLRDALRSWNSDWRSTSTG